MLSTPVENLVIRQSAARFAGTQGYRLEGDKAHLNADVRLDDVARADADWALQLWACEGGKGDGLEGIKVAELPVGSLPAAAAASVEGWAVALPPAGQESRTMVLALASGQAGLFDCIHDLAVFPAPERFCQPSLRGAVGYRFEAAEVELSVDAVTNPRDAVNLSGSLSLELWALPRAYQGGAFEGFCIAGGELGCLAGQASRENLRLNLPAAPLPPGTWQMVLMLREWTPAGFVTRDYANFSGPVGVAEPSPAAKTTEEAVSAAVEPSVPPTPQQAPKTPARRAEPAMQKAAVAAEPVRVSINRATAAELAAVKGLGRSVAAAIVAARPYASLEEVVRAKGMGPKLLEKLREGLTL